MKAFLRIWFVPAVIALMAGPVSADPVFFSTGNPDGLMATASRPNSAGKIEIESGDDFVLTAPTRLTSATFTGLLPTGDPLTDVANVRVEIYRVFPLDSNVARMPQVPTRVNSPSDVEFDDRSASANTLTFTPAVLASSFTAANSVLNGIHLPNPPPGGDGPVTGQEVQFNVTFTTPFSLPADHYFFVPQVQLTSSGNFFWLSAPRPIVSPGTPFPAGFNDLQEWIRNDTLAPDWLRVGTDIVGGTTPPTFNATFSVTGQTIPEPPSLTILALGVAGVFAALRIQRRGRAVPYRLAAR
jgi:hypothetical protein